MILYFSALKQTRSFILNLRIGPWLDSDARIWNCYGIKSKNSELFTDSLWSTSIFFKWNSSSTYSSILLFICFFHTGTNIIPGIREWSLSWDYKEKTFKEPDLSLFLFDLYILINEFDHHWQKAVLLTKADALTKSSRPDKSSPPDKSRRPDKKQSPWQKQSSWQKQTPWQKAVVLTKAVLSLRLLHVNVEQSSWQSLAVAASAIKLTQSSHRVCFHVRLGPVGTVCCV